MAQEIGNNYEQIRLQYGDEVAKSLDNADGKEDKNISQKNLSIFNLALKLLQEEKQGSKENPRSNRISIDNLAPWAREVATKALNYLEKVKENDRSLMKSLTQQNVETYKDQEKTKSEILGELKQERENQKNKNIDFGL